MSKLAIKLGNFANALIRLKEAVEVLKQNNAADVVRDGVINDLNLLMNLLGKPSRNILRI